MNEFTVMVGLKGSSLNSGEYSLLDKLMDAKGLKRRVHPLDGRFHPANFLPRPGDLPHATYYGRCDQDVLALRGDLLSNIPNEWHPDITIIQSAGEGQ
jgi:hypothetical protein